MPLDYVRKIVSGKKARFQDEETAVDLDLVYGELLPLIRARNDQQLMVHSD